MVDDAVGRGSYDLIVTRYFPRAVLCGLWKYRDKLVIDCDDALPFFFLNQIFPSSVLTTRVRLHLAAYKIKRQTRRTLKQMRAAFFANEATAKECRGVFLPNIPFYTGSCPDADLSVPIKRILFVGQLDYLPNKEGLTHFLEKVYTPLRERLPNVEMHVVGQITDDAWRQIWENYKGVTVTGFVDDLKREYEQSHVVVAPVYRCGATNIKLLEAMSMNRACVTTQEAFDKMRKPFEKGRDLYVAANDDEFVEELAALLTDEKENQRIAGNAKSIMNQYYSFDAFCNIVKSTIE